MDDQQRRRQASAPAPSVFLGGGGAGSGAGGPKRRMDDAARGDGGSCCCSLCGDVGFRESLLPCGARGCSRLQHTYCGSRYCPDVVTDVKRWRCEWCAREDSSRRLEEDGGGEEEEREDSSSKRCRRAPPTSRSSSPPDIKKQKASPSPERSADKQGRTACPREDRRGSTSPGARPPAPRAAGLGVAGTDVPADAATMTTPHRDKQGINTRGGGGGGGGGSRALDRWKNLAKRTRLGGKKYKLLADVLC